MVVPDAVHSHACGKRILARGQPFRQREASAGGMPRGGRQGGSGVAVSGHFHEARLRFGAMTVHVAADHEIRWRGLVPACAGVDVTAFHGLAQVTFTGCGFVARSIRREAVVAVGDAHGERNRYRSLLFQLRHGGLQPLLFGLIGRRHHPRNFAF